MNHPQALIGQPYAPGVMKVLERLEWECARCCGHGKITEPLGKISEWPEEFCGPCNGTGKIHYSHTPQVGEWLFIKTRASKYKQPETLHLITSVYQRDKLIVSPQTLDMVNPFDKAVIFILEWEEVVRIVEKATKYSFEVIIPTRRAPKQKAECVILEPHIRRGTKLYRPVIDERADFPQEAVMKAVGRLGKVMKK